MEALGQGADHPPPPKKFKKGKNKTGVHGASEPVEVTTPENEHERGRPGPGHRASVGSVFTVRNRDKEKHVTGEASFNNGCGVRGHQAEGSSRQVKVEGNAPIGWQRHHQELAEVPSDIVRAPEDPTQTPTPYVSPTPQGTQTLTSTSKYYGHGASSATPQQHVPPKMHPQLRVDTASVRTVSNSVAPSPATHYIPHSGISAPSASVDTWTYHTAQYSLPTPQQAPQYSTPGHYSTPVAVQSFANPSYVQHPGMQSQQHSPDNYPPPPETQMHPHHHTPDHPVAFDDAQYAAPVARATPAVYQAGQSSTGVSPQPAIVYQYPPQPIHGTSMPQQAHHTHAQQGSAPRGIGYGMGIPGYPTQPQLQSDVQSMPPQVQSYTPTTQGTWDQSGQDHLAAYPSGFVQPMSAPVPMSAHPGFDQDLGAQRAMEISFTIPPQPWDPATSDINTSAPYAPGPNAYTNAHSY